MNTALANHPNPAIASWVCLTSSRFYYCQQTDVGWTASSVSGNATAVLAEALPHQAAALAVLWQVVLKSDEQLTWVNQALLPDHPDKLKQIINYLSNTSTALTLECFSPYYAHSFSTCDLGAALTRLTQFQSLFPGSLNGPTFTYQRLVNAAGHVLGEIGNANVVQQFQQFAAACALEGPSESIPDDVLPELV